MKKTVILLLVLFTHLLYAQDSDLNLLDPFAPISLNTLSLDIGKYGIDTIRCEENLTIYNEFYKQKSYNSALSAWFYLFTYSPKRTKNIYIHGATMYKSFIKNETDSVQREVLIDNLLKIYDQRNRFYPGQEGKVLGLKGSDLYKHRKGDLMSLQKAYQILKESFEISQEKSEARALNYYFQAGARLTSNKTLTKENLIELFSDVSSVIDYKEAHIAQINFDLKTKEELSKKEKRILSNNAKELKTLNDVRANMEKVLAPHVTCDKLVSLYESKFDMKKDDSSWLERAAQLLKKGDCIDTQIYFQIAGKLYDLNPTARSAFYMGYLSLKQGDYTSAINYFSQAVEGEDDNIKKADYLLYLAKTYAAMGSNSKARRHALEANENRSGWGEPFMLIGDLYAQTSRSCGQNTANKTESEFTKRVGYWAALEKYAYAKRIDESLTEEANQKIQQYSEQAPDKTSTFQMGVLDQPTYKIECGWYVEVVKNPYFSN